MASTLSSRRPAGRDYLKRNVPAALEPGTRPWLIALCEAELAWAAHDWRLQNPKADDGSGWSWGTPPPEFDRLPHETAAAGILNLNGKRAAFRLALDNTHPRDIDYRAGLDDELAKIDALLARATAQYHALRAVVDWRADEVREAA